MFIFGQNYKNHILKDVKRQRRKYDSTNLIHAKISKDGGLYHDIKDIKNGFRK